jgi:5-methylcytosine-specific restriction enzyme subunit McrC
MVRLLTLNEYRTTEGIQLAPEELAALRQALPSISIAPSVVRSDAFDLTPTAEIGTVNLGTLALEIRPKLPIDRVLFLLAYAFDPARWREFPFDYSQRDSLLEAIIPGFVSQVRQALSRSILRSYHITEDVLTTIRGRVRIDDQLRRHFGLLPPAEVRYDEFNEDIEENRLIKAAIARLGQLYVRSHTARRSLRAFDAALALVTPVIYEPRRLPDVAYNRINLHYRPAIELAKLILRSASFEVAPGGIRAPTFLVDMNAVFENFAVVALREALGLSARVFPQGMRGHGGLCLDAAHQIRLEPDISWWDDSRCVFVGDVKYKRIGARAILHPDLYQLLAYTIATDLPSGLLIYAAGEAEAVTHEVLRAGKRLEVMTLDVQGTPEEILRQVERAAERVRGLRREAMAVPREYYGSRTQG